MATGGMINPTEARQLLRQLYDSDREIHLEDVVRRAVSDPVKPLTNDGKLRPSTALVLMGLALLLVLGSFVYFSFGGSQ